MRVRSVGQGDPLEEGMVTHSSILAWRIPWREEPGGLESMGSQRIGHDRATWHAQHTVSTTPHKGKKVTKFASHRSHKWGGCTK